MSEVIRISRTTHGGGGGGGITPAGNLYERPLLTGQTTSYRTGDDAWNLQNGIYTYNRPANPLTVSQLDDQAVSPFITLKEVNAFATLDRFTDDAGGQTYANDYIIDHLTGLGWYNVFSTSETWNDAIDNAMASTQNGFNDWRVNNYNEYSSIRNYDVVHSQQIDYPPFNHTDLTAKWTSTTYTLNTVNAWFFQAGVSVKIKTGLGINLLVRNHYN